MVSIYPIDSEDAMDFNDKKALIDGIHHTLAENQALVEVENGRRISGFPYIYRDYREIVETLQQIDC